MGGVSTDSGPISSHNHSGAEKRVHVLGVVGAESSVGCLESPGRDRIGDTITTVFCSHSAWDCLRSRNQAEYIEASFLRVTVSLLTIFYYF